MNLLNKLQEAIRTAGDILTDIGNTIDCLPPDIDLPGNISDRLDALSTLLTDAECWIEPDHSPCNLCPYTQVIDPGYAAVIALAIKLGTEPRDIAKALEYYAQEFAEDAGKNCETTVAEAFEEEANSWYELHAMLMDM